MGQKKRMPKSTPEQMDRHMMSPKLLRMRMSQKAAVGTDARREVPAALTMVGPRWVMAARTRTLRDLDLPVRMVSDWWRQ